MFLGKEPIHMQADDYNDIRGGPIFGDASS